MVAALSAAGNDLKEGGVRLLEGGMFDRPAERLERRQGLQLIAQRQGSERLARVEHSPHAWAAQSAIDCAKEIRMQLETASGDGGLHATE